MLQNYKKYLTEKYPSGNTTSTYLPTVEKFLANFPFTRDGVQQYTKQLKDLGRKSSTINGKLSALKNYNYYLLETQQIDSLMVIQKDRIKIQEDSTSPNDLTLNQVEKVLKEVKEKDTLRNFTIVYLIVSTGIRRNECATILLSNINLEKRILTLVGKGNKERIIYLNDELVAVLYKYINSAFRNEESKYLFTTKNSLKMNEKTINWIMRKYPEIAPHKLRHFWAFHNLNSGLTIADVGNQLGHASLHTTSKYLRPNKEAFKNKINKSTIKL